MPSVTHRTHSLNRDTGQLDQRPGRRDWEKSRRTRAAVSHFVKESDATVRRLTLQSDQVDVV